MGNHVGDVYLVINFAIQTFTMRTFIKVCIAVTALFIATSANAQVNNEITDLVLRKVNALRDSLGLQKLKSNAILIEAADDHSYYQKEIQQLTHFQKTFSKETPSERILYYGGNRTYVAENVASVPVARNEDKSLNLEKVADRLYTSWFHSPGHYANMIHPDMTLMGLAIQIGRDGNVYGTQVFSSNEIRLPSVFKHSDFAWGVRPGELNCKDDSQVYETMFFANYVYAEGDDIYLFFHDLDFFRGVISGPNDGFAVDVVLREQLPCSKENQFHMSEVYDGEMQQPIYKYDLFRNNISTNPKKIRVKIGEVPKYLRGRQWDANIIIINDNILCDYSWPADVPSDIYPLLDVEAYYELGDETDFEPKQVYIDDSVHLKLRYLRSKQDFIPEMQADYERFLTWSEFASKVDVECYASVEGKLWFNERLLRAREDRAQEVLYQSGFYRDVTIDGEENWEMMEEQIEHHNLKELKGLNRDQIKYRLKYHPSPIYDSLLFEQRVNHIYASIDTLVSVTNFYEYQLTAQYDSTLSLMQLPWNKILYEDHIQADYPAFRNVFDSLYMDQRYKTNLLNAASIDGANRGLDSAKVETFVEKVDVENPRQLFNYAYFLTNYWFQKHSTSHELAGVAQTISPEELRALLHKIDVSQIDTIDLKRMEVNILVSGIHYYVNYNDWALKNQYFDEIAALVKSDFFTPEEAEGLALFCNHFHKFDQAVEILDPFHEQGLLSEDGLFILAKTSTLIRGDLEEEKYHAYMESAKKANQKRYCAWLDEFFQIQRDEHLKRDFCRTCR